MITPPVPAVAAPRRSRLGLWLTLGGLAALITVGIPIFLFYRLAHRFEKEYAPVAATLPAEMAAARKEGLPTTIEELRPNPPVKDADNAAPLYRKLTVLYQQKAKNKAEKPLPTSYLKPGVRTAKQDQEIHTYLTAHTAELALVEQAARKPVCDFARDWSKGFETTFPELSVMRSGARLLMLRAALESDENKPIPALQDVALAARIADHSASDPTFIGALVKIAIQAIASRRFVEILQRHGSDPTVLPSARRAADALGNQIDLRHAFMGEMVLSGIAMKDIRDSPDFAERMRRQNINIPTSNPRVKQQMADAWQAKMVSYWRRVQSSMTASRGDMLTFEHDLQRIQREEDANRLAPGYEMNALLTSVFLGAPPKLMQNKASDHLRKEMVALLEYKQKAGTFPNTLNELPETSAKTDPFTNQPLRYRKKDKGFILYSVSNNRKDDGGSTKSVKVGDSKWPEDIVVAYP